jgi:deoxyribodipyrimidine photolyase
VYVPQALPAVLFCNNLNRYTYEQLEQAKTHDALWNGAQRQMVAEGKMHGFMRMYWAKKILEWTEGPAQALAFGIKLNDRWRRAAISRIALP